MFFCYNTLVRNTILSVTNFLYVDDEYLMLHRQSNAPVDANKLNGIGGKLEKGENYLDAAIRETKEETGYIVSAENISFVGLVRLEGGYPDDWVMAFFKIKVDSKEIPHGENVKDGKLLWMHKDTVLSSEIQLVDDLHYCWKEIVNNETFFMSTIVGEDEKIKSYTISKLPPSSF